ncbi:MAG: PEP-CTERM sorting domain-containing protein [Verrucomicrobiales bacterium]
MKRRASSVTVALACAGSMPVARATTVITFEGFSANNTDIALIVGYGDNVNGDTPDYTTSLGMGGEFGTPDLQVDWLDLGWDTYTGWDGRGSVAQTDYNGVPNPIVLVVDPTDTTAARIIGYDLDVWTGGTPAQIDWSVTGPDSGILANGSWIRAAAGRDTITMPGGGVIGQVGESLSVNFLSVAGLASYLAMDNFIFDQVPEPSVALLGGMALGAAALRRRRQ